MTIPLIVSLLCHGTQFFELALPQFKAMPILGQFCMRQISRRIRFIALEAFSLLASVYVVSRDV